MIRKNPCGPNHKVGERSSTAQRTVSPFLELSGGGQSACFCQPYVLLELELDRFRPIHSCAQHLGFDGNLTWNQAESPAHDALERSTPIFPQVYSTSDQRADVLPVTHPLAQAPAIASSDLAE
ncbi:hypothetical protein CSKR_110697 [Clonorchis sinensis]|uniref:Uncharacterized protein n=1 Tax=Clonorchis sinensis TaxID=79923 RepID=A0A3R7CHI4_CLOSI|nr:hypothetical protein CSKR_110697 [Clonorchis sinensis]